MEKYSVLMSLYNDEKSQWLEDSLNSMINQTIQPEEIVLVLDGPITGALKDCVRKFQILHPKLMKIVPLQENMGLAKALDIGLEHCKNELVARMDTDDISLLNRCELQLLSFDKNPQLDLIGTNIDEFYDEPHNIVSSRKVPSNHNDIMKFIKRRSPFNHPTVMFRKSSVINSGGYGELRRKQDLDLFSRMINSGCIAENLPISLLLFRSNEDNFRRRKSWAYVKGYIIAQYAILKRGHCGMDDFLYVLSGQIFMFFAPMWLLKKVSAKYLRNEA